MVHLAFNISDWRNDMKWNLKRDVSHRWSVLSCPAVEADIKVFKLHKEDVPMHMLDPPLKADLI